MNENRKQYPYGSLTLPDAHVIATRANALLLALQEYEETDESEASPSKGLKLGDILLEVARTLTSNGVFSNKRFLSELLIYAAAVVQGCEVCALTHMEGAVRARAPDVYVESVMAIALYIRSQKNDHTRLLFAGYKIHWQRYEEWPRLSNDRDENRMFYNMVALLMGLVVRKRRIVRFHTYELLTRTPVKPSQVLEVVGIAQAMGGFPARWEAVHVYDVARELRIEGKLPDVWVAVLDAMPEQMK